LRTLAVADGPRAAPARALQDRFEALHLLALVEQHPTSGQHLRIQAFGSQRPYFVPVTFCNFSARRCRARNTCARMEVSVAPSTLAAYALLISSIDVSNKASRYLSGSAAILLSSSSSLSSY